MISFEFRDKAGCMQGARLRPASAQLHWFMHPHHQTSKIINHAGGMGVATVEDVRQRALELAKIDGRTEMQHTDTYWAQAQYELHGGHDTNHSDDEVSTLLVGPDMVAGSLGHHVPNYSADESEFAAEELYKEGMEEAEHEQMLAACLNADTED